MYAQGPNPVRKLHNLKIQKQNTDETICLQHLRQTKTETGEKVLVVNSVIVWCNREIELIYCNIQYVCLRHLINRVGGAISGTRSSGSKSAI